MNFGMEPPTKGEMIFVCVVCAIPPLLMVFGGIAEIARYLEKVS